MQVDDEFDEPSVKPPPRMMVAEAHMDLRGRHMDCALEKNAPITSIPPTTSILPVTPVTDNCSKWEIVFRLIRGYLKDNNHPSESGI